MIEIRSYRAVFELERRIYRIDRLRLNPGGVPVRGCVYFLALLAAALLAGRLPLMGTVVRVLPWYMRDLALPSLSAALLTVIRIEGRPFHLAAHALARYATGPKRLAGVRPYSSRRGWLRWSSSDLAPGERWYPPELLLLPDGSDGHLRRLRYTGPGAVLVAVAHERAEWRVGVGRRLGLRPALTLRELRGRRAPEQAQVIALAPRARLAVKP
jgi:hypothetical protein